jgi:hypothetical protein
MHVSRSLRLAGQQSLGKVGNAQQQRGTRNYAQQHALHQPSKQSPHHTPQTPQSSSKKMGVFSGIWAWMCRRAFNKVDYNKDGRIDSLEVEVAILSLYNVRRCCCCCCCCCCVAPWYFAAAARGQTPWPASAVPVKPFGHPPLNTRPQHTHTHT